MPTLHDLMADSVDGRAHSLRAAEALPSTRGLIARRRRRNTAVAGGTSALAIGGLVAAGILQDARSDDAPAVSRDPDAVALATVPAVTEDSTVDMFQGGTRLTCGDAVPESGGSLDGFALETQLFTGSDTRTPATATLDDSTSVLSTVTYNGSLHAPVFLDVGYGVLAKDGVVVATVDQSSARTDLRYETLRDGASWSDVVNLGRNVDLCSDSPLGASSYEELTLPAGDYQFYAVAQATVTEELIGLNVLANAGYGPADSQGAWAPGSIDCTRQLEYRDADNGPAGLVPLACEPDAVPGASIDADAGTIAVPYRAGDYTEDVDVTLVSEAFPIRLDEAFSTVSPEMWASIDGLAEPTPASEVACGLGFSWIETDAPVGANAADGLDSLLADGGGPILLDEWADPTGATVTLDGPSEAWLTGRDADRGNYIAGRATASFTPSDSIVIDRYSEYSDVSLALTDVQWCGAPPDPIESIIITGAVSVTGNDGTVSRGTSWYIQPR